MSRVPDTILVAHGPGETRSALLAGDDILELAFARDGDLASGMVIAGRVTGFLGDAAFVEVGDHLPGVLRGKKQVREGEIVAVRVIVPARAGKGAELKAAEDVPLADDAKTGAVLLAAPDAAQVWWKKYRGGIGRIVCAPASEHGKLRAMSFDAPLDVHTGSVDLFESFGVEEAIEAALEPMIALPCGGAVIIETTSGATVIDVDAGRADPATANAEAVVAIAHALRLHNVAGHILIDIIPPARGKRTGARAAAKTLADRLAELIAADPIATEIAGVTPLGMIELIRRRVGLSLAEMLGEGERRNATKAYDALRRAVRLAQQANATRIVIAADAPVAALLQTRLQAALVEAGEMSKAEITVRERPGPVDVTAG